MLSLHVFLPLTPSCYDPISFLITHDSCEISRIFTERETKEQEETLRESCCYP